MDATNTAAARRARWAVAAIFMANGFMVGSWAPHIPLVLTRLDITKSTLGLLILCFGIGALISMPWCGWLMARFGHRAVLKLVDALDESDDVQNVYANFEVTEAVSERLGA